MRIACAPNLRDLGGKSSRIGGQVRTGQLYRAEAICTPGANDAATLAALGIRLVCDLRSERERDRAASHWLTTDIELLTMDIAADFRAGVDPFAAMRDDPGEAGAIRLMIATYESLPEACALHLATLFDRLADGAHPMLIHCTAGKDRTGFFAAMILSALGVAEDEIVADYLLSGERQSREVLDATRAIMEAGLRRRVDDAALQALGGVRPEYLAASLAVIHRDFGSVDRYLECAAGLDAVRRARLVDRLVS